MFEEIYLRNLDKDIWKLSDYIQNHKPKKIKTHNRSLSEDEWIQVKSILEKNIFIVKVGTCRFGFSCAINIVKITEPVYPMIPFEFETILSLESYHLPGGKAKFDEGWEEFYPFFNNSEKWWHHSGEPFLKIVIFIHWRFLS